MTDAKPTAPALPGNRSARCRARTPHQPAARLRRLALTLAAVILATSAAGPAQAADPLPIADAHIHYSHDAWDVVPTAEVIGLMRKAGLRLALVSSSDDEGTQRLYQAAPELIVPSLRPYRSRGEISTWARDETVVRHLEERLARYRYAAIGEFHLYGADADLPVPRRLVQLARQHNLILHAHSDADAVERLFAQWPQARILWAHAGFERPEAVRAMLRRHPRLWADLAFRSEHGSGGKVDASWRDAFVEFPDRFMVGTDTFTPERLYYIPEHAAWTRAWLTDLPIDLAERIAWRNAQALVMPVWQTNRAQAPETRPSAGAADAKAGATMAGGATVPAGAASGRASAIGCADPGAGGQRLTSARAELVFRTTPARIAVGQRFSVLGTVCPRQAGAVLQDLHIDATMPEHQHGMNYAPRIVRQGGGDFRADGLLMHMPGRWQLRFEPRIDGRPEPLLHELVLR
ncbi:MAG: hypothetical protein NTV19_16680 [Burkholderiales bacterium]|nr:hypothetical protein [Burkholderiales bacterium]